MHSEPMSIEGAFVVTAQIHGDSRGMFFEWFKAPVLAQMAGHPLNLAQANCSVSSAGTLRGIHYADVPPRPGMVRDVPVWPGAGRSGGPPGRIAELRPVEAVELNTQTRRLVYLSEGLGHWFVALQDASTVVYLCSTAYNPGAEHEIDPFDPDLATDWGIPSPEAALSAKDAAAPGLLAARDTGLLPDLEACRRYRAGLADASS